MSRERVARGGYTRGISIVEMSDRIYKEWCIERGHRGLSRSPSRLWANIAARVRGDISIDREYVKAQLAKGKKGSRKP